MSARAAAACESAIYSDVSIGARVVLHSGSMIGADGFGFALTAITMRNSRRWGASRWMRMLKSGRTPASIARH